MSDINDDDDGNWTLKTGFRVEIQTTATTAKSWAKFKQLKTRIWNFWSPEYKVISTTNDNGLEIPTLWAINSPLN